MCGIFGYFDRRSKSLDTKTILELGRRLEHRGPDDSGVFIDEGVAIGNQRLSIIDVEGGHQPFYSDDQNVVVVQNGEIYNYIELREELEQSGAVFKTKCDTEVILKLYEMYGLPFVDKLNGMFAIAIYDKNEKKLSLVRDRLGIKPLYVHDNGKRLVFASEIKSILAAGVEKEINYRAIDYLFTLNWIPAPETIFKGIHHLLPGYLMQISTGETREVKWWDLANQHPEEKSEQDCISEIAGLLDDSVRLRMRSDVPFGAFLSGGVDSSSIVSMMSRQLGHGFKTFHIGFGQSHLDETAEALKAANLFGVDHFSTVADPSLLSFWPISTYYCDQPHGDTSFLATYQVSALASKHVKVALTGDGADELFAGYSRYLALLNGGMSWTPEVLAHEFNKGVAVFTENQKAKLYSEDFKRTLKTEMSIDEITIDALSRCSHLDHINQALFLDTTMLLPGNNLVKPDRMSMAVSLEARVPFLDHRLVETAFRIPGHLKLKNSIPKYLLKEALRPILGAQIVDRPKQMFTVPISDWLVDLEVLIRDEFLLSSRSVDRGIFDPGAISLLFDLHRKGDTKVIRKIRLLTALELWFRVVMEEETASSIPPFIEKASIHEVAFSG
jgi:asparagine synthase (glutamine-hydrolysing)